jgi:archaellum biogenesis protein FlaJ (TadC family)
MLDFAEEHQTLLYILGGASIALFIATLIFVPALLVRIPPDYFAHEHRPPSRWADQNRAVRLAIMIARNILGAVLILAGLAMLLLPGQGLLTVLVGIMTLDIPGKYRFEKWIISRKGVLKAINWLRKRRHKEPLTLAKT